MRVLALALVLCAVAVAGVTALDAHANTKLHVRTRGREAMSSSMSSAAAVSTPHRCCCRRGGVFAVGPSQGDNPLPVFYKSEVSCAKRGGHIIESGTTGDDDKQMWKACETACRVNGKAVGDTLNALDAWWDKWKGANDAKAKKYQSVWDKTFWRYPNKVIVTPFATELVRSEVKKTMQAMIPPVTEPKPSAVVKGPQPDRGKNVYHDEYLDTLEPWKTRAAARIAPIQSIADKAADEFAATPELKELTTGVTTRFCRQHLARVQTALNAALDANAKKLCTDWNNAHANAQFSKMLGIALDTDGKWWGGYSGEPLADTNEQRAVMNAVNNAFKGAGDNDATTHGVVVDTSSRYYVTARVGLEAEKKMMQCVADYEKTAKRGLMWRSTKVGDRTTMDEAIEKLKTEDAVKKVNDHNFAPVPAPNEVAHPIGNCAAQKLFHAMRKAGVNVMCLAEGWVSCAGSKVPVATSNGALQPWGDEEMVPSCATCQAVCPALLAPAATGLLQ